MTLVILYNIMQPVGWQIGLVRIEDIAIGCAVSLLVGLLFWPRGAGAGARQGAGGGVRRERALPGRAVRVRHGLAATAAAAPAGADE